MDLIKKMPGYHPNVPVGSRIADPFAVITEESNTLPVNAARAAHAPQDQPPKAHETTTSEGGSKRTSSSLPSLSDAAANLATKRRWLPPTDDTAARIGLEFGSPVDTDAHAGTHLTMPQRVNLHEAGLPDVKINMPAYNISPTATLAERAVCRFHEVNELYDSTLNSICAYAFSTIALDMTSNEVFTYTKTMQQLDALQFVKAMDKEIDDHQS